MWLPFPALPVLRQRVFQLKCLVLLLGSPLFPGGLFQHGGVAGDGIWSNSTWGIEGIGPMTSKIENEKRWPPVRCFWPSVDNVQVWCERWRAKRQDASDAPWCHPSRVPYSVGCSSRETWSRSMWKPHWTMDQATAIQSSDNLYSHEEKVQEKIYKSTRCFP